MALAGCGGTGAAGLVPASDMTAVVLPGEAFAIGDYLARPGWKLDKGYRGAPRIRHLRITQVRGLRHTAQLVFRFYRADELLAEVSCSSHRMQKGQSARVKCFSSSARWPKRFDALRVTDSW